MRLIPKLRASRTRRLFTAAALGVVAIGGAAAPAQAAGPPMDVEQEVELSCTLRYGAFVLPNLQLFFNVHATVPEWVTVDDTVFIENGYAEIRIPPPTADALSITGADTVEGEASAFTLGLTNTDPASINLAVPPIPYGPQLVAPGVETTMRVPATGVLDPKGPIVASETAAPGQEIETRLLAMDTVLHGTNSTNPTIDRTLPFNCVPSASGSNFITSIPIVEAPAIPVVDAIDPATVFASGGETVTLTGENLDGATVTVDGEEVAAEANAEGTSLTFTAPAHAPGTVDVVVSNADGSDTVQLTYEADPTFPPVIGGISPDTVYESGGETVTISGENLDGATVTVDGDEVAAEANAEGTELTFTAPAHAPGTVDVVVTNDDGSDTTQLTYEPDPIDPPSIGGISPGTVYASGGELVTISGEALQGATVTVDGEEVDAEVNAEGTELTFEAPAHEPGTVDVVVTTPGGSDTTQLTYEADPIPAPSITAVSPTNLPEAGGEVTITGENLQGATVTVGGTEVDATVNAEGTELTFTAPAGEPGTVEVVVTTPGGEATAELTYDEDPVPAPTISGIEPSTLPVTGGDVTITGENLGGATVTVDGAEVDATVNAEGTELTFTAPAGEPGTVDVVVTTEGGQATAELTYEAEEIPAPSIDGISPSTLPATGGEVTITGENLQGATVTVGGAEVDATVNAEGTEITFTAPAHAPGIVAVVVTTEGGEATAQLTYEAEEIPAPSIDGISPASTPETGGETITISGENLDGATVTVDGAEVDAEVNAEGTEITFTAPAHAPGTVDVVVTTEGGEATAELTYTEVVVPAPPVVDAISPASGPTAGGTSVTITGENLAGATVEVDGVEVDATANAEGTSLTFTTPAHAAGTVTVTVSNADGEDTAQFTYVAPPAPAVTGLNPTSGPAAGGNQVTITGTNLSGATAVTFGSANATIVSNTATQIVVTAPAGTGTVDVRVTNANGQSANTNADNYTYQQDPGPGTKVPTIGFIVPNKALANIGGISVVTGTNFDTTKRVTVGGKTATYVKVNKTTLLVLLPPLKKGTYDLVVTNAAGTSATGASSKVQYLSLW